MSASITKNQSLLLANQGFLAAKSSALRQSSELYAIKVQLKALIDDIERHVHQDQKNLITRQNKIYHELHAYYSKKYAQATYVPDHDAFFHEHTLSITDECFSDKMDDYIKTFVQTYQTLHKNKKINEIQIKKMAIQAYNDALQAIKTSKEPFRDILESQLLHTLDATEVKQNILSLNQIRLIKILTASLCVLGIIASMPPIIVALAHMATSALVLLSCLLLIAVPAWALFFYMSVSMLSNSWDIPIVESDAHLLPFVDACPIQMNTGEQDITQLNQMTTLDLAHLKRIYTHVERQAAKPYSMFLYDTPSSRNDTDDNLTPSYTQPYDMFDPFNHYDNSSSCHHHDGGSSDPCHHHDGGGSDDCHHHDDGGSNYTYHH